VFSFPLQRFIPSFSPFLDNWSYNVPPIFSYQQSRFFDGMFLRQFFFLPMIFVRLPFPFLFLSPPPRRISRSVVGLLSRLPCTSVFLPFPPFPSVTQSPLRPHEWFPKTLLGGGPLQFRKYQPSFVPLFSFSQNGFFDTIRPIDRYNRSSFSPPTPPSLLPLLPHLLFEFPPIFKYGFPPSVPCISLFFFFPSWLLDPPHLVVVDRSWFFAREGG